MQQPAMHDAFGCARLIKLLDEQLPPPCGSGSQSGRLRTTDASLAGSAPSPSSGIKPTDTSGEACAASDVDGEDASVTTATTAASPSVLPLMLSGSTETMLTPSMLHGTADAVMLCMDCMVSTLAVQLWPDRVSAGGGVLPDALVFVASSRVSALQCSAAAVAPSASATVADVMLIAAAAAAEADVYSGSDAGGDAGGDAWDGRNGGGEGGDEGGDEGGSMGGKNGGGEGGDVGGDEGGSMGGESGGRSGGGGGGGESGGRSGGRGGGEAGGEGGGEGGSMGGCGGGDVFAQKHRRLI
jgi:hypothetical protein